MASERSRPSRNSTKRQSRTGSKSNGAGSSRRARSASQLDSEKLEGRPPSHDPDVYVDIRKVKVDEIYVDVEQLEAHLALRAKLANLLQVVAGVHVHVGKVEVDIKGVEVEAELKVRLENLYDILDRALTTLDRKPEILESLVKTVDDTVGSVGELGQKALGQGRRPDRNPRRRRPGRSAGRAARRRGEPGARRTDRRRRAGAWAGRSGWQARKRGRTSARWCRPRVGPGRRTGARRARAGSRRRGWPGGSAGRASRPGGSAGWANRPGGSRRNGAGASIPGLAEANVAPDQARFQARLDTLVGLKPQEFRKPVGLQEHTQELQLVS